MRYLCPSLLSPSSIYHSIFFYSLSTFSFPFFLPLSLHLLSLIPFFPFSLSNSSLPSSFLLSSFHDILLRSVLTSCLLCVSPCRQQLRDREHEINDLEMKLEKVSQIKLLTNLQIIDTDTHDCGDCETQILWSSFRSPT